MGTELVFTGRHDNCVCLRVWVCVSVFQCVFACVSVFQCVFACVSVFQCVFACVSVCECVSHPLFWLNVKLTAAVRLKIKDF